MLELPINNTKYVKVAPTCITEDYLTKRALRSGIIGTTPRVVPVESLQETWSCSHTLHGCGKTILSHPKVCIIKIKNLEFTTLF